MDWRPQSVCQNLWVMWQLCLRIIVKLFKHGSDIFVSWPIESIEKALVHALEKNQFITELHLQECKITDGGLKAQGLGFLDQHAETFSFLCSWLSVEVEFWL